MPDIKISNPREFFEFQASSVGAGKAGHQPLKIVVLADLSGRPLDDRPQATLRRVDKDNFDSVFARTQVSLRLPYHEQAFTFQSVDDLHPDHLYQHHPVFERIRALKSQLPQIRTGLALQAELANLGIELNDAPAAPRYTAESSALLDSVLAQPASLPHYSPAQALIQDIVAPYVEAKRDPEVEKIADALDELACATLRELLHSPAFKQCEASWRSLDWLNRVLDTDRQCHLYVLDIHPHELMHVCSAEPSDFTQTNVYQMLVDHQAVAGGQAFDVFVLDTPLAADAQNLKLLSGLGDMANTVGATLLASGRSLLGGADWYKYLEKKTCPVLQPPLSDLWRALCTQAAAAKTYLSAPGFLVRLPYGPKTRSCEYLPFEEFTDSDSAESYLWGNGAYLLCMLLAERAGRASSSEGRVRQSVIEGLSMHVQKVEGDTLITPPAELYLSDREAAQLNSWGFTVLRSVLHRDAVTVDNWCSLAECVQ